jgi:hypothetical protein
MANGPQRNSSSNWLVGVIIVLLIAIVIAWAGSGRWRSYYSNSNDASTAAPKHAAHTSPPQPGGSPGSGGTTGRAHDGTTGSNPGTNTAPH